MFGKRQTASGLYAALITSQLKLHTSPYLGERATEHISHRSFRDITRFQRESVFLRQAFDAQVLHLYSKL